MSEDARGSQLMNWILYSFHAFMVRVEHVRRRLDGFHNPQPPAPSGMVVVRGDGEEPLPPNSLYYDTTFKVWKSADRHPHMGWHYYYACDPASLRKPPTLPWWAKAVVAGVITLIVAEITLRALGIGTRGEAMTRWDSTRGAVMKPNLDMVRDGWRVQTDANGFRLPITGDVLCLGDSMTFGWGVEGDETFPARLGGINVGVPATSPQWWLTALPGLLEQIKPSAVVLQVSGNDVWEIAIDAEDMPIHRKIQPFLERLPYLNESAIVGLVKDVVFVASRTPSIRTADVEPVSAIVDEAKALCDGYQVLVVSANSDTIPCDIRIPGYDDRPDWYLNENNRHWNAAGCSAVAELIARRMRHE